ncbi:MAG: hypothetical protein H3C35_13380 [Bacteroidetes bacterium]|nr:hypothetical protein [Bacteroidota bacterium]
MKNNWKFLKSLEGYYIPPKNINLRNNGGDYEYRSEFLLFQDGEKFAVLEDRWTSAEFGYSFIGRFEPVKTAQITDNCCISIPEEWGYWKDSEARFGLRYEAEAWWVNLEKLEGVEMFSSLEEAENFCLLKYAEAEAV